jgi:tetratricopeptide (TPR) repeat protein
MITVTLFLLFFSSQQISAQVENVFIDSLKVELLSELNGCQCKFWIHKGPVYTNGQKTSKGKEKLIDFAIIENSNILVFNFDSIILKIDLVSNSTILAYHSNASNKDFTIHFIDMIWITPVIKNNAGTKKAEIEKAANFKRMEALYETIKLYREAVRRVAYEKSLQEFIISYENLTDQGRKVLMTDEQRKIIVQANMMHEEKEYVQAIRLYEKAIEVNPFSYPSAYYNVALLYAQLYKYHDAVLNMNKYLLLVPDAEDARASQDKIYEWELNAK